LQRIRYNFKIKSFDVLCDVRARLPLEPGIMDVSCTLEEHSGITHYDEVFSIGWKEEMRDSSSSFFRGF